MARQKDETLMLRSTRENYNNEPSRICILLTFRMSKCSISEMLLKALPDKVVNQESVGMI